MTDVVLIGPAGVGKDSVASALAARSPRYKRYAFADNVKRFLEHQYPSIYPPGVDWDGAKKDPKTRKLLQDTGMAGRALDPYLWINMLEGQVDRETKIGDRVVITDARMANELETVHEGWWALLVYLNRSDLPDASANWRTHVSENEWSLWISSAGLIFDNDDWTPESVAEQIDNYLNEGDH